MFYVITRHAAASDFVARKGFSGAQIVAHAADDFWAGLKVGDVVVGTLPIHLAARACKITRSPFGFLEVNVPADARGHELSLEEMERFGASISWWSIEAALRLNPPIFLNMFKKVFSGGWYVRYKCGTRQLVRKVCEFVVVLQKQADLCRKPCRATP